MGAGFRVAEEKNSWSRSTESMKELKGILSLSTQTKLIDDRLVPFQVRLPEVIQKFSPAGCHHKQTSTGMEILAVRF
jgi:hypothetical protein